MKSDYETLSYDLKFQSLPLFALKSKRKTGVNFLILIQVLKDSITAPILSDVLFLSKKHPNTNFLYFL